ncbi:MAG: translation initiation factor IF-2 [Methanoregulaceae archaeon]
MSQGGIRTPIVCVLGHVDHGKTSLLDRIRGSSVVSSEAGAITQHIGATLVPIEAIQGMSAGMQKVAVQVPGLLFIDTPGHHAFTTLRARGGALADMAIVVVDINEGFQPQTEEALSILRNCRTPFVVALTKIDRVHGWRSTEKGPFLASFAKQNERVTEFMETRHYEIVGKLSDLGFNSERFDRVTDFARTIAIVPVSAHTGEGISDLLMVMIGLAQRYMGEALAVQVQGPGQGTVLEVKEERGLGLTLDVILFDGTLSVGDQVLLATADGVVQTKVKSLLKPRPMKEILTEDRFERVRSVIAASGVKVAAPGLDGVIAGSPLRVVRGDRDAIEKEILDEVSQINVTLSDEGLIIKADTIGALEALSKELESREIGVMRAAVGPVSRHDLVDAQTIKAPLYRAVLAFNAPLLPDAQAIVRDGGPDLPQVFQAKVIYQLIDEFVEWRDSEKQRMEKQRFERIILPAKVRVLPGCIFRQSNPAVVGIRVLGGTLRTDVGLVRTDGRKVGHLKTIQSQGEYVHEVEAGAEIAVAIEGATVGRQFDVDDELYVDIPERHVKVLEKEMLNHISTTAREILEEYTGMRRRAEPFWGK